MSWGLEDDGSSRFLMCNSNHMKDKNSSVINKQKWYHLLKNTQRSGRSEDGSSSTNDNKASSTRYSVQNNKHMSSSYSS